MYERLQRGAIYPVIDWLTLSELQALGNPTIGRGAPSLGIPARNVGAIWTGEKRCPKQGEWYLSGATIGAYRARSGLLTPYHIARVVLTETVTIVREVPC